MMKIWNKYTGPDIKQKLLYVNLRVEVAAVSRNRYGVDQTVDTHKILINAIKCYFYLQEIW
jgi:hypothetical protein